MKNSSNVSKAKVPFVKRPFLSISTLACLKYTVKVCENRRFWGFYGQIVNNIGTMAVLESPQEVVADTDRCLTTAAWYRYRLCGRIGIGTFHLYSVLCTVLYPDIYTTI